MSAAGSIVINVQSNYGTVVAYPACEKSRLFAEIAGSKTLTVPVLNKIQALGYSLTLESGSVATLNKMLSESLR